MISAKKIKQNPIKLPKRYSMNLFPKSIDFIMPEFDRLHPLQRTLVIKESNSYQLYDKFYKKICTSLGKNYLPICRFGDGEYVMILGKPKTDFRLPFKQKLRKKVSRIISYFKYGDGINAYSQNFYHSGQYSLNELNTKKKETIKSIKDISEKGILAFFLNFEEKPCYENHFPSLDKFLIDNKIAINSDNYFPGYFVYGLMSSSRQHKIIYNHRILIVNGAVGKRKEQIIGSLLKKGAKDVFWVPISEKKSFFDVIDISKYIGKVDIVFLGAGLGKFSLFSQLEPLNVPVLDIGFIFEVLANPDSRFARMFCATDKDWEKIGSDPITAQI